MSKELFIEFHESYTFPSYQDSCFEELEDKGFRISEFLDSNELELSKILPHDTYLHQILGHPNALQWSVRYWWAFQHELLMSYPGVSNSTENDFILLLQIDLEDKRVELSESLGDSSLYFRIHKSDLISRKFEKSILVIQNTWSMTPIIPIQVLQAGNQ